MESKNPKVTAYLDDLQRNSDIYDIVLAVRRLVLDCNSTLTERIMYGGLSFHDERGIRGGIYVYSAHVSKEFGDGYLLKDTYSVLEGGGKSRRHIKLYTQADVGDKHLSHYIREYYA